MRFYTVTCRNIGLYKFLIVWMILFSSSPSGRRVVHLNESISRQINRNAFIAVNNSELIYTWIQKQAKAVDVRNGTAILNLNCSVFNFPKNCKLFHSTFVNTQMKKGKPLKCTISKGNSMFIWDINSSNKCWKNTLQLNRPFYW